MKQFTLCAFGAALLLTASASVANAQTAEPSGPLAPQGGAITASATKGAPAPPAVAAQNSHDPNQVLCKRVGDTASRLGGERQCRTRAQWDADEQGAAEMMRGLQEPGSAGSH